MTKSHWYKINPVRKRFLLAALPLVIVLGVSGMFYDRLGQDSSILPSALIGKPVPEFALPSLLEGQPGLTTATLRSGRVSVVNVFASWCAPCRLEHPLLLKLKDEPGVTLFGIDYKDKPEAARALLQQMGDPYKAIGMDRDGRVSINWGVYGVPETYVISGTGKIVYKHVGPLDPETIETKLLPIIRKFTAKL